MASHHRRHAGAGFLIEAPPPNLMKTYLSNPRTIEAPF
jgi:hypothetical protein